MKLVVRLISVLFLLLLASPVILLKGCRSELCGGCPADSSAPAGSTVTIVSGLTDVDTSSGGCTNALTFEFKDSKGDLLNGICVEIFTNGFIKLSSTPGDCSDPSGYVGYIRTRTDAGGTVTVDFSSGALSCGTSTEDIKYSFFVQVSSCTAGATSAATWTLKCS